MAHTGNSQPNMSTTFLGKSKPEEEVWRHTPRSALAKGKRKGKYYTSDKYNLNTNIYKVTPIANYQLTLDNLLVPTMVCKSLCAAIVSP